MLVGSDWPPTAVTRAGESGVARAVAWSNEDIRVAVIKPDAQVVVSTFDGESCLATLRLDAASSLSMQGDHIAVARFDEVVVLQLVDPRST